MTKYYFNKKENICAEEMWVVGYIMNKFPEEYVSEYDPVERKHVLHALRNKDFNKGFLTPVVEEISNWRECTVSDTIYDCMEYR